MKKKLWLCFFCFFSPLLGQIKEVGSIRDIVELSQPNALVVVDLNGVITVAQQLGSEKWAEYMVQTKVAEKGITKDQALRELLPLWQKILLSSQVKLVEPCTADIIHRLQKNGVQVLGLSSRNIELAYETSKQLKCLDVDLNRNASFPPFKEIKGKYPAKLIDGILFLGPFNSEEELLLPFFKESKCQKFVLVSSKMDMMRSLEKVCEQEEISFLGLFYNPLEKQPLDPLMAKKQLEYFGKILSEDDAKKLLATTIEETS